VVKLAHTAGDLAALDAMVSMCAACPRLVDWRHEVAVTKRRAFADEPYWGRPITGWGSDTPKLLVLGLAPAAHGGNRTGRVFTGDRSGDQLFAALYRAGLVSSPLSLDAADGLRTKDIRIVAAVRCAPPANAPTPAERATCEPWLEAEWRLISSHVRVIVVLGGFGWRAALGLLASDLLAAAKPKFGPPSAKPKFGPPSAKPKFGPPSAKPKFGHGAVAHLKSGLIVMGCYHPSQQNMFTGRLTPAMLDEVFTEAAKQAGISGLSTQ
jgi:uracil-DNA glycosylase family 4